jgi:hypothetical protein
MSYHAALLVLGLKWWNQFSSLFLMFSRNSSYSRDCAVTSICLFWCLYMSKWETQQQQTFGIPKSLPIPVQLCVAHKVYCTFPIHCSLVTLMSTWTFCLLHSVPLVLCQRLQGRSMMSMLQSFKCFIHHTLLVTMQPSAYTHLIHSLPKSTIVDLKIHA